MRIGIEINGVLRDTIGKIKMTYEKFLMNEDNEDDFVHEIIEPINSLNLLEHFKFKNSDELFEFLYEDCPMEIFGHAMSSEMMTFNYLNDFYKEFRDNNEIVIISDEISKSKPSTLFFLSKFSCLIEEIIFYNEKTKDKIISSFDLIVTSSPDLLINYSNKLSLIKFETEYNKEVNSDYQISTLKDLNEIIKKLKDDKNI
jgi:hypothetical protein